jgi:RHS repeat-associated protein
VACLPGDGAHPKARGLARPVAQAGPSAPPAGQTWKLYYHANGKPIAMRVLPPGNSTGTLYFLHSDHLGSTSAVTDLSGSVIARQWYYPYGSVRASTGALPTDITFTAQRSDATGLYFYNARYYAPLSGRFISADTIVPEPGNPQDLNRYAYARGNPLKYTDPTGHFSEDELNEYFPDWRKWPDYLKKLMLHKSTTWGSLIYLGYDGAEPALIAMVILSQTENGRNSFVGRFLGLAGPEVVC